MEPFQGERKFLTASQNYSDYSTARALGWLAVWGGAILIVISGCVLFAGTPESDDVNRRIVVVGVLGGVTLLAGASFLLARRAMALCRRCAGGIASTNPFNKDEWFKVALIASILLAAAIIAISLHWKSK